MNAQEIAILVANKDKAALLAEMDRVYKLPLAEGGDKYRELSIALYSIPGPGPRKMRISKAAYEMLQTEGHGYDNVITGDDDMISRE
jgi:hypothetical protein